MARPWSKLTGVLALALVLTSCGGASSPKMRPTGTLSLHCDVAEAEVWVDGRYYREVAELRRAFRLSVGEHRIEIRHAGHHSMYYEVTVKAGSRQSLEVELAERLP